MFVQETPFEDFPQHLGAFVHVPVLKEFLQEDEVLLQSPVFVILSPPPTDVIVGVKEQALDSFSWIESMNSAILSFLSFMMVDFEVVYFDSDSTLHCHAPKLLHYFHFTKFYLGKFQKKF